MNGSVSHDITTTGCGSVAVGGGGSVVGLGVFVGFSGTLVEDGIGACVRVGTNGFCVSVGISVAN